MKTLIIDQSIETLYVMQDINKLCSFVDIIINHLHKPRVVDKESTHDSDMLG